MSWLNYWGFDAYQNNLIRPTHYCSRVLETSWSYTPLIKSGDFPPDASSHWYALKLLCRPVTPLPGLDLILCHQLFPGTPGSLHASHHNKMCFTLWPFRKHANTPFGFTCAPQGRHVKVCASHRVFKTHTDPILSCGDLCLALRAENAAAEQPE